MSPHISIDRDAVSAFCRRHHIKRLALFGSVLREDFRPDSDVDVLVEFQPGHVPGLNFVSIERELSGLLHGRRVDMAKKACSKTQGLSRAAYDADENLRLAVTHLIQIIGEAGRNVSRGFCDEHPEIRWADIIAIDARSPRSKSSVTDSTCSCETGVRHPIPADVPSSRSQSPETLPQAARWRQRPG